MLRIAVGYPDLGDEKRMLTNLRKRHPIETLQPVADQPDMRQLFDVVTDVYVEPSVEAYLLTLVRSTRDHPDLAMGASPRASLAFYHAAQALAAIRGRDFVIPDDIKELAPLVLPHRLIGRPGSQLRGRGPAEIVDEIVAATEVPIEDTV